MNQAAVPSPPQKPHTREIHGEKFEDPYFWLRQQDSPEVQAHLTAENQYYESYFEPRRELVEELTAELKGRLEERTESVPAPSGRFEYWSRYESGQEYQVFCRRPLGGGDEQTLLDLNVEAEGKDYLALGTFNWSYDGTLLAYAIDNDGSEKYTLKFRELATGKDLAVAIPATSYGSAWGKDNQYFFYTKLNDNLRPFQVWRHRLGTDPENDQLVFQEDDERFFVGLSESLAGDYITIESHGVNTSEVYGLATEDSAEGSFECLQPREFGVEYHIWKQADRLLMVTNKDALDFKVLCRKLDETQWQELIPHTPGRLIEEIVPLKNHLAMTVKQDATESVLLFQQDGSAPVTVEMPEPLCSVGFGEMYEFDANTLRLSYSSMVTPNTTYDYEIGTTKLTERKVQKIPSGYDRSLYVSERIFAKADDGEQIPLSIVYRKDLYEKGKNPGYLFAYGSYGYGISPYFSTGRISLLDRGFVFALAHIRGGDDRGRRWYEAGKMANKMNTFTDFVTCAQHLQSCGLVAKGRLAAMGGSAGGMLMGGVANMAPQAFGAVVAHVPFVDCINTMLDTSLPLTQGEFNEWGNPAERATYQHMIKYSPYENVAAQSYPPLFVTAGLNDPRVTYWEPAKWVARLRDLKTDDHPVIFKINMEAGHGGKSGRFASLVETAEEFAFIFKELEVS